MPAAYLASLEPAARRAAGPPAEQFRMLQVLQHIGLPRVLGLGVPMPLEHLSPDVQREVKAVGFKTTASAALYEEAAAYDATLAEAMAAGPLRADMPLVVLVRGQIVGPPDQDAAGKAANADLARRTSRGHLVTAEGSGHFIQLDRPDLVMKGVEQIIQVVRSER
jgi:pimeloyl-ACP methyl ester carboxylesterase